MRCGRFTEDQIIAVLAEHEAGLKDLCRKRGVSDATCYNRKTKFGGMTVSETAGVAHARRREPSSEEAAGGVGSRQCRP
jgi:hypothetical protein